MNSIRKRYRKKYRKRYIVWFDGVSGKDVRLVGGKNASLGELLRRTKAPIPPGFAITSNAYWYFVKSTDIFKRIKAIISGLNVRSVKDLRARGRRIRQLIERTELPDDLEKRIVKNYRKLGKKLRQADPLVAVRSSATAEDLAEASFAGQQETFLNVKGERELLAAVRRCMASLFTDRAISYREDKGFEHTDIALSVGVQAMIQAETAGVAFTIDPDSGFERVVCIEASWGLGETVVKGLVTPDVFYVFKPTLGIISKKLGDKRLKIVKSFPETAPTTKRERKSFCLTDEEAKQLAKHCIQIENHYRYPQDIEWVKDRSGKLFIVQSRPETVHALKPKKEIEEYVLKQRSRVLLTGESIGRKIAAGKANVIESVEGIGKFRRGQILVTDMTEPEWEPIMKIAAGIVANKGGRTSHCAIVSRELGIPAIIGTEKATKLLRTGQSVTLDCRGEVGKVWKGKLKYAVKKMRIAKIPKTRTKVFVNVGVPEQAYTQGQLPVDGVGLAREEFIIASHIGEHPLAMIAAGRANEYVEKLASGIAKIAAAFYPNPVIVRFSDFKTNEYAGLKGGRRYEPDEANPMLGWRGAARYISKSFEPAFRLECRAIKKVRDEMKLTNVVAMLPFCRTIAECKKTLTIMRSERLVRGRNGLEVYIMAEIPSNIILADQFAKFFDGFSIGSNDLTQLTLGIDRDSAKLASIFDESNEAVLRMIKSLIKIAHKHKCKVSICGEAPSTIKGYVEFLVKSGIDSISVNSDVALETKLLVAKIERKLRKRS